MTQDRPVRVAHLSDTHFLEDGASPEGGFAYDTDAAFAAVRDDLGTRGTFDLVAVTGDVADHGRAGQYRKAADAFATLPAPVNLCPGNHDQHVPFVATAARPSVNTSRVVEVDNWCFLFADSNAGVMTTDSTGQAVDPVDYDERLHRNGSFGAREMQWIRDAYAATQAEHVFVWVHHPPASTVPLSDDEDYTAEWRSLLPDLPKVRGIGGGHTHVPDDYQFEGIPVFVCPALKNNFDLANATMLPPGYRTYDFSPDGSIQSPVWLVDDDQWPRHPLGRAVMSLLNGELTYAEFEAIAARRAERG